MKFLRMRPRRLALGMAVAAAGLAAVTGALLVATRPAPIAPAAALPPPPDAATLAAGARVVALGDCMVCHTAGDGPAYAGGYPLRTPFGTIYSTNITPDPDTGIGRWTLPAFERALRAGVSRDGHLLYPAFPYIHTARMSERDIELAWRYLLTRTPVRAAAPPNALPFPLNVRPLLAFWNLLYLRPAAPPAPVPATGARERGRYLAESLGHCGACHSGLGALGGERRPAYQGGTVDGWDAPSLTALAAGPVPWRQDQLVDYLRGGLSPAHGAAKGPMRPVTERLADVPREDVEAIAAWLMSIQAPAARAPARAAPRARADDRDPGALLFGAACAACHAPAAPMMRLAGRPGLERSSELQSARPDNFILTVLQGVPWQAGSRVYMPPFADTLDDVQIAQLAGYVRGAAGRPAWPGVAATSTRLRKENPQ